jgi:hypothetical protein
MELWFERLPQLLKGYEAWDVYNAVDEGLVTCGVLGRSCRDSGEDVEAKPKPMPSSVQAFCAFETVRPFTYAHDTTERDQMNIIKIERLLFSMERKSATK